MTKEEAQKILPLVNNKQCLDALETYLGLRVEELKESLVKANDDQIRGAILELRRMKHLRDEVLQALER